MTVFQSFREKAIGLAYNMTTTTTYTYPPRHDCVTKMSIIIIIIRTDSDFY